MEYGGTSVRHSQPPLYLLVFLTVPRCSYEVFVVFASILSWSVQRPRTSPVKMQGLAYGYGELQCRYGSVCIAASLAVAGRLGDLAVGIRCPGRWAGAGPDPTWQSSRSFGFEKTSDFNSEISRDLRLAPSGLCLVSHSDTSPANEEFLRCIPACGYSIGKVASYPRLKIV